MAFSSGAGSSCNGRVVALVDMDCFYVQVEQRRNPDLKGKPCVVVQYKKWRGGGIIAVGYEARKFGVTRQMRGDDAKEKCPDVNVIYVQENRGKADLTVYREAGAEVIKVLSTFSDSLERASIDEAYLDLSDSVKRYRARYTLNEIAQKLLQTTHVTDLRRPKEADDETVAQSDVLATILQRLSIDSNLDLAVGALVANEMRDAVLEQTGFTCSAGIACNKMLAKLVAGMNKPKQQTIVFTEDIPKLYETVKLKKVRHLGGKLGAVLQETFNIETMQELSALSLSQLKKSFGDKTGDWIFSLGQGIDNEPIRIRQLPKSAGCCKNFRGPDKLDKVSKVSYWLNQLASEICERLEYEMNVNNRVATNMSVSMKNVDMVSGARSCKISRVEVEQITSDAMRVLREFNNATSPDQWDPPLLFLGLSTCKFEERSNAGSKSIKDFLLNSSSTFDSAQRPCTTLKNAASKNDSSESTLKCGMSKDVGLEKFFISGHKGARQGGSDEHLELDSIKPQTSPGLKDNFFCSERKGKFSSVPPANEPNQATDAAPVSLHETDCLRNSGSFEQSITQHETVGKSRSVLPEESMLNSSDSDAFTLDDFAICRKCGNRILQWDMPEHNDFHFAQDLQHDLNRTSDTASRSSLPKTKNKSPPRKKLKRSTSSIHDFFKTK